MPAALVTGASKGIGAAIARRLAHDGYDVAIHYHTDREGAEAVAHDARGQGRRVAMLPADLRDTETAWGVVEDAASALGGVDALVLSAGMYDRRRLVEMDGQAWTETIAVHLSSPAAMAQAAAPHLAKGPGAVLFVSSVAAHRGSGHGAHYAAAKAGVEGLMRSLARELAPVRVNCIAPGYIATQILAGDDETKSAERMAEVPLARLGRPEDVAAAAAFLLGADSSYVTGQVVHVDGGLWMG